jgi:hypothetical protein
MRVFGNLMNRIAEHTTGKPEVGMGATACAFTDRYAGTIIRIISPTRIEWQEDTAVRTDNNGMSECQTYDYKPNPDARKVIFSKRKNGVWREMGTGKDGLGLSLGERRKYYDYSF